jgi:hypothetical protein
MLNLSPWSWDQDNPIKENYINYTVKFSIKSILKDKIKNNQLKKNKKMTQSTKINPSNLWPKSWDGINLIENISKYITKSNSKLT